MRRILSAAIPMLLLLAAPASSRADAVGAGFGAGTGLVVAGPVGAVVGGVVGACWIDNGFYQHCRYYAGRWYYY
jgi:hypothetical protein